MRQLLTECEPPSLTFLFYGSLKSDFSKKLASQVGLQQRGLAQDNKAVSLILMVSDPARSMNKTQAHEDSYARLCS